MGRYLIRRLLLSFAALFGLASAIFFVLRLLPGGPFDDDIVLAPMVRARLEEYYGLNQSLHLQYWQFIKNIFYGDFGRSILHAGEPVSKVLASVMPITFLLATLAMVFAVAVGFAMGLILFLTHSTRVVHFVHWFFLSAPTLFLGPIVILVFGIWLDWLPVTIGDSAKSYILPILVLMVKPAVNFARLVMASLQETLQQPWVTTARSFGYRDRYIVTHFAIKQSLIPVLSYLGSTLAGVYSGSLIVETLFNIHGSGTEFLQALLNRDYSLISALTLFYGLVLICSSFIFDLLMYSLDPRMDRL